MIVAVHYGEHLVVARHDLSRDEAAAYVRAQVERGRRCTVSYYDDEETGR